MIACSLGACATKGLNSIGAAGCTHGQSPITTNTPSQPLVQTNVSGAANDDLHNLLDIAFISFCIFQNSFHGLLGIIGRNMVETVHDGHEMDELSNENRPLVVKPDESSNYQK